MTKIYKPQHNSIVDLPQCSEIPPASNAMPIMYDESSDRHQMPPRRSRHPASYSCMMCDLVDTSLPRSNVMNRNDISDMLVRSYHM